MTRTREAFEALHAALAAAAAAPGAKIPVPHKNELLPERLGQFGDVEAWLNVLTGEAAPDDSASLLGADMAGVDDGFEIVHRARIEWAVTAADEPARKTAFDLGCKAINDAIKGDRTLGGAVAFARWASAEYTDHAAEAMPQTDAADITIELTFTSSDPF